MLGRVIIIVAGAGLVATCAATAVLTIFHINPATTHLKNQRFYEIGYAAVNAVLIPFGVAGFIGGVSRKKTLIKAFVTFQWWLATFILIGLNIFNFILSENCKVNSCNSKQAAFIQLCAQGGAMIGFGAILVIVGRRVYSSLRLEEETKSLLAKANFNEKTSETNDLGRLSPNSSNSGNANASANANANDNINVNNNIGRYETNVIRQPSKATMVNEDLVRRPTNANINAIQNPALRNQPDPNFVTPYNGLSRNQTTGNIPPKKLARYPTNATDSRVNVTRQPTIGNAYAPRNYVGTRQATYPAPSQPIYPPPPPSQAAYPPPPQSQAAYPPQPPSQVAYPPPPQSQAAYPPPPQSQVPYPVPSSQAPYFVAPSKATYSTVSSQRSLSTNPPSPSYITQVVIPPPPVSKANNNYSDDYDDYNVDYNVDYNEYDDYDSYKLKPYAQTKAPQLTRMGMNNNI